MNSMKRQKDRTLRDELPRSVGAQYATGHQWRNNPRKNERMEPKQKQYPVVDVTGYKQGMWTEASTGMQARDVDRRSTGMWIEARSDAVKSSIT